MFIFAQVPILKAIIWIYIKTRDNVFKSVRIKADQLLNFFMINIPHELDSYAGSPSAFFCTLEKVH